MSHCIYVSQKGTQCTNSKTVFNLGVCKKHFSTPRWYESMGYSKAQIEDGLRQLDAADVVVQPAAQPQVQQLYDQQLQYYQQPPQQVQQYQPPVSAPPTAASIPISQPPPEPVPEPPAPKPNAKDWLDEVESIQLPTDATVADIDAAYDELLKEEPPAPKPEKRVKELKSLKSKSVTTTPSPKKAEEKKQLEPEGELVDVDDSSSDAATTGADEEEDDGVKKVAKPYSQLILKLGYRTLVFIAESQKPELLQGLSQDVECEAVDEILTECSAEFEAMCGLDEMDCWGKLALTTVALAANRAAVNKSLGVGSSAPQLTTRLNQPVSVPEEYASL